jgi:UDP-glucose 4-epimerase
MKICVTGGSGFIATNMLVALKKRYPEAKIVALDIRPPIYSVDGVTYLTVDVRDKKSLEKALAHTTKIFHLAALIGTHESFVDPNAVFDTNVGGTLNMLAFAQQHGIAVYVAGMPGIWNNPYSISKDASVRLAMAYHEAYGVHACSLRWFSVYGPYQYVARYNKAIPTFVNRALKGEPIQIYGDGEQIADNRK